MAKDKRLYMTFPNDFWMHPKIAPLSIEAKWTFVEMNGYSRMQDLDGTIPAIMAGRFWSAEALAELVGSHPERPVVLFEPSTDSYVIRDYSEHQQTTAERDERSQLRSRSGKAGADSRWNGKPMASAMANGWQTDGKGMAETEIETETSKEARKRAVQVPKDFAITDPMREWAAREVPLVNVDLKLSAFIDYWVGTGKANKDWVAVWRNGMRKQQEFAERDRPAQKSGKAIDDWFNR